MFTYKIDEKTKLKMLNLNDTEPLFMLTNQSKDSLREWLPFIDSTKSSADTEAFIRGTMKQFSDNNGFQAGIWFEEQIAGVIGFHKIDWNNKSTSLGYWLGKGYEGSGLMTKSVRAFVNHAIGELGLNRVEIRAAEENTKSRAIPERLNFTEEGRVREAEWLCDHYVDHIVYGMLAKDWNKSNK
ncbi:GNAT family protein [Sporosarcina sp. FSL K6-1540]|uniref:Ribosomal-protein-serine acetyltransferase n=1 Tax=Sporosarcina psychrophila TaxID=1476 RepID=A0ABV2K7D7_SPOPS|nr:GNAT family protein [Sporosarcina psychrophila]AMQ06454.1 alanine acetyltransferase [Sporosarcina psychrophila]